jgi:ligand-binding SRPBCC domain-containing protein
MKIRILMSEIWLPASVSAVFDFFSNASNLNEITPPWLKFRILSGQGISMTRGTFIDYSLKIHGVPVSWQSEIQIWDPPYRFVDAQRKGPYRKWVHAHDFEERENGTLVRDRVEYAVHGWIFESLVDRFLVRPDLERIFHYRRTKLQEIFSQADLNQQPDLSSMTKI